MNRADVETGIRRAWSALEELSLAESFSSASVLDINPEFRDLALAGDKYTVLYMTGLRLSHYNILLSDYAFFQFSWSAYRTVRYAYYPNPFIAGYDDLVEFKKLRSLVEEERLTLEQYHSLLSDKQPEARVPLLRYENAPDQWRELRHPCSHFHIGNHSENRWALRRILTPLAFALFVCKQYYRLEWEMLGDDDGVEYGNSFEGKLIAERQNCRVIGEDYFSANEARSFHWA